MKSSKFSEIISFSMSYEQSFSVFRKILCRCIEFFPVPVPLKLPVCLLAFLSNYYELILKKIQMNSKDMVYYNKSFGEFTEFRKII